MIIQELAELARREGLVADPDFEPKPVRWIVVIGIGGRYLDVIESMGEPDPKGKVRPKVYQVPRSPARTSGSSANFLVDKAEYAFGFDPDGNPKKIVKLEHHRELFAAYVERALSIAPEDAGLVALIRFLRDDKSVLGAVGRIAGKAVANDLLAFRYSEGGVSDLIHDRAAVRAAWKALRHPAGVGGGKLPECIVCGELSAPVAVHPLVKRVPGGSTSGISMISANAPAFESFGLSIDESAPTCRACSDAYTTALNRLFHPVYTAPDGRTLPPRSLRLSDDTAVIYWTSGADEHKFVDEFGELDSADGSRAGDVFEAFLSGRGNILKDTTPFFALIITGGQGRATLRGYFQSTIGEVAAHLRAYFADIEIVRRYENSPRWPPLSWLVRSLAAQGEWKNVDPDLAGRLFLAVLSGSPFPSAVLSKAIARIRAERDKPGKPKHSRERLALVRATLNRQFRSTGEHPIKSLLTKETPVMLDPACGNNAYCLGRLFAVLEKLQGDAIGNPGATIVDRFYGAASANPATVFAPLLRKAQHHQAKLDGAYYPRLIQEILGLLPAEPFPSTLNLEEQGLFALGYYHQKAELWRPKPKPQAASVVE